MRRRAAPRPRTFKCRHCDSAPSLLDHRFRASGVTSCAGTDWIQRCAILSTGPSLRQGGAVISSPPAPALLELVRGGRGTGDERVASCLGISDEPVRVGSVKSIQRPARALSPAVRPAAVEVLGLLHPRQRHGEPARCCVSGARNHIMARGRRQSRHLAGAAEASAFGAYVPCSCDVTQLTVGSPQGRRRRGGPEPWSPSGHRGR